MAALCGGQLISGLVDYLRERGWPDLCLSVGADNSSAIETPQRRISLDMALIGEKPPFPASSAFDAIRASRTDVMRRSAGLGSLRPQPALNFFWAP